MINLPNLISLIRIPLALVFLQENVTLRSLAVVFALLSDGLDGYIARRNKMTTRLGTILDPLTDRFFVIFALVVLTVENSIPLWKLAAIFCRDFAILLFGISLAFTGKLHEYYLRAIWCGKITTVLQLMVLFSLTLGVVVPDPIFYTFFALGGFAFVELLYSDPKIISEK